MAWSWATSLREGPTAVKDNDAVRTFAQTTRLMLTRIHAVLFDFVGTLLDRRLSFDAFMREQWKRFPIVQAVPETEYVQTLVELDRDGYAPRNELFAGMLARFDLPSELED